LTRKSVFRGHRLGTARNVAPLSQLGEILHSERFQDKVFYSLLLSVSDRYQRVGYRGCLWDIYSFYSLDQIPRIETAMMEIVRLYFGVVLIPGKLVHLVN
jgi:hypothetical protein